jgi:hypothetical protein
MEAIMLLKIGEMEMNEKELLNDFIDDEGQIQCSEMFFDELEFVDLKLNDNLSYLM